MWELGIEIILLAEIYKETGLWKTKRLLVKMACKQSERDQNVPTDSKTFVVFLQLIDGNEESSYVLSNTKVRQSLEITNESQFSCKSIFHRKIVGCSKGDSDTQINYRFQGINTNRNILDISCQLVKYFLDFPHWE